MTAEERDPKFLHRRALPRKMRGLRARREKGSGQPAGLSHQRAVRPRISLGACSTIRTPSSPTRCCDPELQDHGHFRGRHGQHRRHAEAGGANAISTTAASSRRARRCRRCCTSCSTTNGRAKVSNIPTSANCSRANICWRATGTPRGLKAKQAVDRQLWRRHVDYLDKFLKRASHADEAGAPRHWHSAGARPKNIERS